jgi:hypothetical protein
MHHEVVLAATKCDTRVSGQLQVGRAQDQFGQVCCNMTTCMTTRTHAPAPSVHYQRQQTAAASATCSDTIIPT